MCNEGGVNLFFFLFVKKYFCFILNDLEVVLEFLFIYILKKNFVLSGVLWCI